MDYSSYLKSIGIEVKENADLLNYSTMKLEAKGHLVILKSKEEIIAVVKYLASIKMPYRIIGKGSNSIFKETSDTPYLFLDLNRGDKTLSKLSNEYELSGATPLSLMTKCAIKFGLKGWEYFTGIPGSLGGSIAMNAGTNLGEIGSLVKKVSLIDKFGNDKTIEIQEIGDYFRYRGSKFLDNNDIIYHAVIKHEGVDSLISQKIKDYLTLRAQNQPLKAATCGCTFKNCSNGVRVGKLLDDLGLKGYQKGHFRISPIHANFIEHLGGGSYSEIREFTLEIMKLVKEKTGIELELEIKL